MPYPVTVQHRKLSLCPRLHVEVYLYHPCRACAQLLVSAVAEAFQDCGGLAAVLEGVVRRWGEADAAAAAGKGCWWQMREAGMLAVSTCSETAMVSNIIRLTVLGFCTLDRQQGWLRWSGCSCCAAWEMQHPGCAARSSNDTSPVQSAPSVSMLRGKEGKSKVVR
jgi:hypothetical protein